tara:strand:+ start:390 stop:1682 length:1293 start_codon:yes stop_codon:yes gene_type:complete
MTLRRVVITGMGIVSPLGVGLEHNWKLITEGKSGLKKIEHFDASDLASQIAGIVPQAETESPDNFKNGLFHANDYLSPKEQKKIDRFIQYGIAAAQEAVEDAGWTPEDAEALERTGVMIGSGIGGLPNIETGALILKEKGPRRLSPFFIPSALINLVSGHVSIKYGFKGPNHSVVTACATGTHAIGDAARMIMLDDADVMVAGGAEGAVCRLGVAGFAAARALSTSYNDTPTKGSRPFDKDRDGFVIAEGAGIVVLEELEHAKKRGAKIYGEVIGYGMSGDAYHITSPAEDGDGGFRAMRNALRNAKLDSSEIGYVNAHGTSTPLGDDIEVGAIKRLFANDLDNISISSTKSAIGHLLGAAGAVEAIYTTKALETGILPPTLNLENPSEGCVGVDLIPNTAKEKEINFAVSNSFGFGGTNASLVFKKFVD